MPSTHETTQLVDEMHAENRRLRDRTTAVRAVVGATDHEDRCRAAAAALRRLLELPSTRPGSGEAEPVRALAGELRGILRELEGSR